MKFDLSNITLDQAEAGLEVVENFLDDLTGIPIAKGEGTKLPGEDNLIELFLVQWAKGSEESANKAMKELINGSGALTDKQIDNAMKSFKIELDQTFVEPVGKALPEILTNAYKTAKQKVVKSHSTKMIWKEIDKEATAWLAEHHMYWVGTYYDDKLSKALRETVIAGMKEGHGREAIGQTLKDFFDGYPGVRNKPANYWRGMAANGINRSRQFGLIQGYEDVGVTELEVVAVIDQRTSSICKEMNGRIIPVSSAINQRDQLMEAEDPEDVKTISPWLSAATIKGKSDSYVVSQGLVMPPYHFNCRTTVVEK